MSQLWDLTWFMLRLRRYKRRRVQLEIRVQPGWERWIHDDLRDKLAAEGVGHGVSTLEYRGLVTIRRPRAVAAVIGHLDPPLALAEALGVYVRACADQAVGRRPPPDVALRQERAVTRLMALFPNPPRVAPVRARPAAELPPAPGDGLHGVENPPRN